MAAYRADCKFQKKRLTKLLLIFTIDLQHIKKRPEKIWAVPLIQLHRATPLAEKHHAWDDRFRAEALK